METLAGKHIVITRSLEDFDLSAEAIRQREGIPIASPAIALALPSDCRPLDRAIHAIGQYDWIVFTSVHAVQFFYERMLFLGVRLPDTIRSAAIGEATANALISLGVQPAFIAQKSTGEGMIQEFSRLYPVHEKRFLLPLSNIARDTVGNLLRGHGGAVTAVTAYCNAPAETFPSEFIRHMERREIDWVTFFSSSAVTNFYQIWKKYPWLETRFRVASIGPSTSETLRKHGVEPDVEADPHTLEGILDAISSIEETVN